MKVQSVEIGAHPGHVYRIGAYSVPSSSRIEFEEAMRRSADVLRTLPGFLGHLVLEKAGGESRFELVSIAVWKSREALALAESRMREHHAKIGLDLPARWAEWGVVADRGDYVVPPHLQQPFDR